jgi:hypothetical protein
MSLNAMSASMLYLMQHHLVLPFFRRGDNGLVASLNEAVVGVERVNSLGGVTDDEEDFGFGHGE